MAYWGPSPNLLEYIRPEIHNKAHVHPSTGRTELNVKKQSGAAGEADSSWFSGVRQVG